MPLHWGAPTAQGWHCYLSYPLPARSSQYWLKPSVLSLPLCTFPNSRVPGSAMCGDTLATALPVFQKVAHCYHLLPSLILRDLQAVCR